MSEFLRKNLEIKKVTDYILLVKQKNAPFRFSCCDGLLILPKENRNSNTIAIDLNIEKEYVEYLINKFGKVSHYINSHGHMDHIAHVHSWENLGAKILAPNKEGDNLLNLRGFYECYDFDEGVSFDSIQKLAEINKYKNCEKIKKFTPGDNLRIENVSITTIPLTGHSKSHVGFLLEEEKVFHISCLGFDVPNPDAEGFGPWYGFKQCSLDRYPNDIDFAERLFLEKAEFLTSSHSYIIQNPERLPFNYMRNKLEKNRKRIRSALEDVNQNFNIEKKVEKLLMKDLFFPKSKMEGFLKEIYTFWEYWIIKNHLLQESKA